MLLEAAPAWQASAVSLLEKLSETGDWRVAKLILSYAGTLVCPLDSNETVKLGSIRDDCFGVVLRLINEEREDSANNALSMSPKEQGAFEQIRSVLDRSDTFDDDRLRLLKFGRNFAFINGATTLATICEIATAASPAN